jgi:photosynthetic reaction center H subunit
VQAPRSGRPEPASKTTPLGIWTGTPSDPEGNPLLSASGPAAYALRADTPELVWDNDRNRLEPLRVATDHAFDDEGPNPIGYDVVGFDGVVAGTVSDAWIDREESLIRYLEAKLTSGRSVLIPMPLSQVSETARQVRLASVKGAQVNDAPGLASPDQVTWLEEDRIQAYFASGHLFAEPGRREPLL